MTSASARSAWTEQVRGALIRPFCERRRKCGKPGGSPWQCDTGSPAEALGSLGVAFRTETFQFTSSTQEDDMLRIAVARYGDRAWATVATEVHGRSSKSCSDRCASAAACRITLYAFERAARARAACLLLAVQGRGLHRVRALAANEVPARCACARPLPGGATSCRPTLSTRARSPSRTGRLPW